ncbi:MAG: 3'-5' exonuclease [Parcubacteria group bacterium]
MKLIFLDTETTGNEVGKDRLCELCYKTEGELFTGYFKPPIPVSVKAMSVTHITNKILEDKEVFKDSSAYNRLEELLKEGVLVAHNAKFDIAMLEAEGLSVPQFICTLRVARYLDKEDLIPEYNLQYLRYHHELEVDGSAHDAETDVKVLEELFNLELKEIMKDIPGKEEAIQKMIEISSTPVLFNKFMFGKYKGERLEDVARVDKEYLKWLLKEKSKNEEAEEDWIYTLNHFLK